MGLIGKCCCLTALLSKIMCLLCTFGPLIAAYLLYIFYLKPWGETTIQNALQSTPGLQPNSPTVNCTGCLLGQNKQWPTITTGIYHLLDTYAGKTATAVVGVSLASSAVAGATSMVWASFIPTAAAVGSVGSGFYEMLHIIEQAQFISLLGQLATTGTPVFFQQFTTEMSWTNLNFIKHNTNSLQQRHLGELIKAQTEETGIKRYAAYLRVEPQDLFFYTLVILLIIAGGILVLYIVALAVMSACSKKKSSETAKALFRKVIWAYILLFLLSLYIISMTGCYRAFSSMESSNTTNATIAIGIILIIFAVVLGLGVFVIMNNVHELEDLGTFDHEQRPFNHKYGPYYEEFNIDNKYFFVPKAMLAILTGAVVGILSNVTWQLGTLVVFNVIYLMLLIFREPFLLRFLFYVGVLSTFLKVFLLLCMFVMARDDIFPQYVRNSAAYIVIGVNIAVFALLFIRQMYIVIRKIILNCKHKDKSKSNNDDSDDISSPTRGGTPQVQNNNYFNGDLNDTKKTNAAQINHQLSSSGNANTNRPIAQNQMNTNQSGLRNPNLSSRAIPVSNNAHNLTTAEQNIQERQHLARRNFLNEVAPAVAGGARPRQSKVEPKAVAGNNFKQDVELQRKDKMSESSSVKAQRESKTVNDLYANEFTAVAMQDGNPPQKIKNDDASYYKGENVYNRDSLEIDVDNLEHNDLHAKLYAENNYIDHENRVSGDSSVFESVIDFKDEAASVDQLSSRDSYLTRSTDFGHYRDSDNISENYENHHLYSSILSSQQNNTQAFIPVEKVETEEMNDSFVSIESSTTDFSTNRLDNVAAKYLQSEFGNSEGTMPTTKYLNKDFRSESNCGLSELSIDKSDLNEVNVEKEYNRNRSQSFPEMYHNDDTHDADNDTTALTRSIRKSDSVFSYFIESDKVLPKKSDKIEEVQEEDVEYTMEIEL